MAQPTGAPEVPQFRRLYRDPSNRVVAGVAAGIAEHLAMPIVAVRAAFALLVAVNGLGALLYVAFWAVLPTASRPSGRRLRGGVMLQAFALMCLGIGALIVRVQLGGLGLDSTFVVLAAVVALGAGIIWHQADPQRRRRAAQVEGAPGQTPPTVVGAIERATAETEAATSQWLPLRLVGGAALVVVGIVGILAFFVSGRTGNSLATTLSGLIFALISVAGLVLVLAPLLYRVFGQLREERVARIREQERAEVAAMVHDEVLHTLALIQRRAGDSSTVVRLARGQERSLRNWLYKPTASPTERFAAALEQAAAEVEDTFGIEVETVVVGDADNDEQVTALVAAAREALVNAARHAKVSTVSLYAEAEEEKLSVFVRDRGPGFDLSSVDDDRHGVRGSIIGRMKRHGGQAEIRTSPGNGTEVALTMPRARLKGEVS
jgi:signal transduction histidine kinase